MATYTFREFYVPERMMDGLTRWIEQGIEPGGFLQAVLKNDLRGACDTADDENMRNIPAYVAYLYNETPSLCWGSVDRYKAWRYRHDLARAKAFLERQRSDPHPCEHGHVNCSDRDGGACSDELLGHYPELAE